MRRILSFILLYCAVLFCHAQHQSLNYVRTERMLDSVGITSNVSVVSYDTYGRQEYTIVPNGTGGYSASLKIYDNAGHDYGEWLPVPTPGGISSVTSDYDIEDPGRSFYNDDDPYTWIVYDGQDRVVGNYAPGEYLRSNNICVRHDFLTNTAGSVRRYTCSDTGPVWSGFYGKENLASELTTDEDGKSVETFRDRLGRIVLERRGGTADTYYVYNSLGLLGNVLSPQYEVDNDFSLYGYGYEYDSRRRVVSKRLPGCDEIKYWYDSGDRIIYMQDGRLRERGLYRFFFYDRLGRPVVQGTCSGFTDGGGYGFVDYDAANVSGSICGSGYILSSSQKVSSAVMESCTYYDDYSFLSLSSIPSSVKTVLAGFSGACAHGLATGTVTLSSDGSYSYGITCYDGRARPVVTRTLRSTGTLLTQRTTYTFNGSPSTVWSEAITSGGRRCTSLIEYVYSSHTGRLADTYITLDSGARHHVASLSYDAVGRLSANSRGGNAGRLSYDYNLRGWPQKISSPQFTEWLSYDDGPGTPMYSGGISSIRWQIGDDGVRRGYKFSYDKLGRMTSGVYGEGDDISENSDRYTERITGYTLNGSISGLKRYGKCNNGDFGLIDDLEVEFDGNRVAAVADHAGNLLYNNSFDFHDEAGGSSEYTYDGCGSLTSDSNRGISSVRYDNAGMPRLVTFSTGSSTEYVYSSTGEKLSVKHVTSVRDIAVPVDTAISIPVTPGIGTLSLANGLERAVYPGVSDSLRISMDKLQLVEKLEYAGPFILRDGKPFMYLFEGGYCSYPSSSMASSESAKEPEFFYYTKDHLGNNRTVVSESGELRQVTHYYPFGGAYGDAGLNSGFQPYKYNGKEFDHTHGLNWYDYGARMYSPDLPMWTAMDPKCEEYYHLNPYVYCADNPVNSIDPDGRKSYLIVWKTMKGSVGHAAFAVDNYKQVILSDNTAKMVPDGTVTLYGLFPKTSYGRKDGLKNKTVQGFFKIDKRTTITDIETGNEPNTGEKEKPDGIIEINSFYDSDMKAKNVMMEEVKSNKHYNVQTRNCSNFAKKGVEAASGKKIDNDGMTTPNQLYKDTEKLDNTKVIKSPDKEINNKYFSF